ncbi:MAG: autotransporter outer membrane beta-barrel domain-containing protein [Schwartzia succinivorans]|nr:autotransporter outer membrane beta-barrel domain-containing protein [Schwartzia succinivorans]
MKTHDDSRTLKAAGRKKAQAALALAVSLWMAGGSVASAQTTTIKEGDNYVGDVYGNHADNQPVTDHSGGSNDNTVIMTGGNVTNAVYGAFCDGSKTSAKGNQVTVSGGTIGTNELAGAAAYDTTARHDFNNNTVKVTGLANIQADIDGAVTNNGTANSNHVIITGGTVNKDNGAGHIYGGRSNGGGNATNNTVTISDGTVTARLIAGGFVGSATGGNATGNTVTVSSDVTGAVYGGYTAGGTGAVTGNIVTLNGAKVTGNVYGGYTWSGTGEVTNNTVTLNGATVTGNVYGGGTETGTGNLVKGNTLNLSGVNSAKSIGNFDTVNIKSAVWGTPALTLTDAIGTVNTIDASDVAFSGVDALSAGETTKLIENKMANYQGTIKSGKYKLGTTLEGTGKASVSGDDLIYTIEPGTAREQTHNTVMGASVSMTALSMGNEFVGAATEGLAAPANVGADGVSSFAQMGGGSMRQETGSHVDTHTWNAILALGHQNKKERGTMEYGAFFEYGTGNYTTHADNGLRGDGSARYTGGGLLAKYTMKNSVYVEGSLRAGSVHDDARNVLSDGFGNPYSYDTNAAYMGFHLGVGREIAVAGGNAVDVYGKYFYNRRNGVSFDAGGHYDLDAVTSSVLRVGARYILKRNKWNFYAGAAYEHEFDGKANGTADGVAIRGADTSGGSFRGEIGATVKPGENSPWNIDLNVSGFAGKKQGFTGGVSVALMF